MFKKLFAVLLISVLTIGAYSQEKEQEDPKSFDLTKIGQKVPEFSFTTIDGKTINIKDLEGKTVLINFFATWCPPCRAEMPQLEAQVWPKFKDRDFYMVSLGRDHDMETMVKFQKKTGFTFPIAPDKGKKIYSLFFEKYIPRNVLINTKGEIILQEFGYTEEEFAKLVELIDSETK